MAMVPDSECRDAHLDGIRSARCRAQRRAQQRQRRSRDFLFDVHVQSP